MSEFVWGILGPGWIAHEFANDLKLVKTATHKVGAVLGNDLASAREFAGKTGAGQYFDSLETFLKEAKVDAVYIATPHPLHHQQAVACLQQKIPVLCEKPIAVNGAQFEEMAAAARQNNTYLMEGMWIVFLPALQYVLSVLQESKLGAVTSVASGLSYIQEKNPDSRFFDPRLGGGSLLDLGSYSVFLAHLLLGSPNTIEATATLTGRKIDKVCSFNFVYPNGVAATGNSTFVEDVPNVATIICEKGKITIGNAWNEKPSEITVDYFDGTPKKEVPQWEGHGFQYEIERVYKDIISGKKENDMLPLQLSREMMASMDEIRKLTGITYPYDADPDAKMN